MKVTMEMNQVLTEQGDPFYKYLKFARNGYREKVTIKSYSLTTSWNWQDEIGTKSGKLRIGHECVNTIPPDTEIHEQITMTSGCEKVCTTTSTPPTTVRPLCTIT